MLEALFWFAVCGVIYPYFLYPALLALLARIRGPRPALPAGDLPSVSVIIPLHNEGSRVQAKLENTAALVYPRDRVQILFVSDGSTDSTVEVLRRHPLPGAAIIELPARAGKAAALNAGLERASHDIVVFSDASIALQPDALARIVQPFSDSEIGCVSGEDRIPESGGEAWYGRYELLLRRLESNVHSIVGASGSFYAQRRSLCRPFVAGMAPDFLSVLRTVGRGYRAVSEPSAVGLMTSVKDPRQEFDRKVRTLLRGMTTLFANMHLLNPFRYGLFSFVLASHKIMRWASPLFLLLTFLTSLALIDTPLYAAAFALQLAFYAAAAAAYAEWGRLHRSMIGKIALYFSSGNGATLAAWWQYGRGIRQELWTPSRR